MAQEPVLKSDARIKPEEKGTPTADAALPAAESAPAAEVDEGLFVFPSPVGAGPEAEPGREDGQAASRRDEGREHGGKP